MGKSLRLFDNNRIERIWKIAQTDFSKRYSNDYLGLLWALFNPILRVTIYYIVFTNIFKVKEENYVLILFSGIICYSVFREISSRGLSILNAKRYLIQNIQFDHIDIFISLGISLMIGFLFNFIAYFIFSLALGSVISLNILLLPFLFLTILILSIGSSMILSVINIFLKDIKHLWTILLMFGFWTSGIFQRTDLFIEAFPPLKYLHPFIGIISNVRNITMYNAPVDWFYLVYNFMFSTIILLIGIASYNALGHYSLEKR